VRPGSQLAALGGLGLAALAVFGVSAVPACNNPAEGDGGAGPFDVVAGWSGSPTMNPGTDCMSCHSATQSLDCLQPPCRASYKPWTVAGTIYGDPNADPEAGVPNVQVLIVDSAGKQLTLVSNAAGNFYTQEPLTFPLASLMIQSTDQRMVMDLHPDFSLPTNPDGTEAIGSCNLCHTDPPAFNSPGRIFIPQ